MSAEGEKMESQETYTPGPNAVDISPNQDKGVLKEIITPGEGDEIPCKGNKVLVHYTGKLLDGTKFDSSVDRGEMFEFTLGKGEVIKAWDIGVATMKKGEKCILYCHPDYAYGSKGSPPKIPENSTLVFEVELFKWQMEDISSDKDNGILRSIITEGEGYISPGEGSNVEVHLVGNYNGKQFEERDVKFELGEGCEAGVVEGIEIALKKFKKGEKSKIIIAPKYAWGSTGNSDFEIPPNATVEYEVTLISFEKEKESWNMTLEEKLEQAEISKRKGTSYFLNNKFDLALKNYQKILSYLQYETEAEGENKLRKDTLICAGHLNIAACYLKMEKFGDVIEHSEKALEIQPKNPKGHFRRGKAYISLQEFEKAKENFMRVLEYDPSNSAAKKIITVCNANLKKQLEKEKKMYQNIFRKMAEEREKEATASVSSENQNSAVNEKMETDDEKQAAHETVSV